MNRKCVIISKEVILRPFRSPFLLAFFIRKLNPSATMRKGRVTKGNLDVNL
jgi:hypothetical protein